MTQPALNPRYAPFLEPMREAAERLRAQPWFSEDDWRLKAGPFQDGEGVWVGLSKGNWVNDDYCGIHFEGSLEWGGFKMKHVVCAMHVLHRPTFPGTELDRQAFSVPFVKSPEVRKIIRQWKAGYRVNAKGGMVPFRLNAPRTDDNLAEVVFTEFNRYHQLAPEIDRILAEIYGR
jgi:hypothetical protein